MISLYQYDDYIEIIVLHSPEELNLNIDFLRKFHGYIKTTYDPKERLLRIQIDNLINNENFAIIIKEILNKDGYFSNNTKRTYYNSATRRWSYT